MASPQIENGYLRIATELAEALARVNLSPYESRVLWLVIRKTYGYGKKMDRIPHSQFAAGTGIPERNVRRTIKTLEARRILLIERETPQRILYGLQKDYARWLQPRSPQTGSPETGSEQTGSMESQTPVSTDRETPVSTDRLKRKKISSKDNSAAEAAFERAWNLYPKRAGGNSKKNAHAKWVARVRSGVDPDELIAGVERYARYIRATGGEGTRYVKQCEAFFGSGEHWKEGWEVPGDSTQKGGFVG